MPKGYHPLSLGNPGVTVLSLQEGKSNTRLYVVDAKQSYALYKSSTLVGPTFCYDACAYDKTTDQFLIYPHVVDEVKKKTTKAAKAAKEAKKSKAAKEKDAKESIKLERNAEDVTKILLAATCKTVQLHQCCDEGCISECVESGIEGADPHCCVEENCIPAATSSSKRKRASTTKKGSRKTKSATTAKRATKSKSKTTSKKSSAKPTRKKSKS